MYQKKIPFVMDKKLNKDLENFFYGDPKTWDKILKEERDEN